MAGIEQTNLAGMSRARHREVKSCADMSREPCMVTARFARDCGLRMSSPSSVEIALGSLVGFFFPSEPRPLSLSFFFEGEGYASSS